MGIFSFLRGASSSIKTGLLEKDLHESIRTSGVDSSRSQELILEVAASAWKNPLLSTKFEELGLSYSDYLLMYKTGVVTCPRKLFHGNSGAYLIATGLFIINYRPLSPVVHTLADAVKEKSGEERSEMVVSLITTFVKTFERLNASLLTPL